MTFKAILLGSTASALFTTLAMGQSADQPAPPKRHHHADRDTDRFEMLEQQIQQQAREIAALKARMAQQPAPAAATSEVSAAQFEALQNQVYESQAVANTALKNNAAVKVDKKAHITVTSPDGRYTWSPIVDVMGDYASYSKGQVAGVPLKSSGENFRRAQIGFQGKFAGDFGYKFLYDFGGTNGDESYQAYYCNTSTPPKLCTTGAGSGPHIKEAWVSYKGILDPVTFRAGLMPTPANLSDMTAPDDLLFAERPSPAQLSRGLAADDGRESVGFLANGDFWYASAFLTGDSYGKGALIAPANTYGGSQEATVDRIAFAPVRDETDNFNIHLGGNISYVVHPQEATNTSGVTTYPVTFSDRPELRVDNVTFLNTGGINARSAYSAGAEGAVSYGPLLVQGEYFWYGVHRNNPAAGVTDPRFWGWYVEGSWVITGEPRLYNMASASFLRPSPATPFDPFNGGWGAWELAGRLSDTDLDYHLTSSVSGDAVAGGVQKIASAGINFYPNDILKFMFDFQNVRVRNVGAIGNNGTYNTFEVRTQVSF